MSALISAVMPGIAAELTAAVAETHAREQQFAANLAGARAAYQSTDQGGGEEIGRWPTHSWPHRLLPRRRVAQQAQVVRAASSVSS